jgi:hypothetical protein
MFSSRIVQDSHLSGNRGKRRPSVGLDVDFRSLIRAASREHLWSRNQCPDSLLIAIRTPFRIAIATNFLQQNDSDQEQNRVKGIIEETTKRVIINNLDNQGTFFFGATVRCFSRG